MSTDRDVPELALSAVWQDQRFSGPLRTVDGRKVEVVHRGRWTHGIGPDFQDALLLFDGRELRSGSVEVHLRTNAWAAHGHHLDPHYDDVILHVVLRHDGGETRRHDGALVPVVSLADYLTEPLPITPPSTVDWSRFGGDICAADLATSKPAAIRDILWRMGDTRIAAKAARIEAQLTLDPPGEALYREVWDGLGFSSNRAPMRALAMALPLAAIEGALSTVRDDLRLAVTRGLLFGLAGFLPLSPADAAFGRLSADAIEDLESQWRRLAAPWQDHRLPPTAWTRARVRPANHPVARLAAGATMLAKAHGGIVATLLAPIRSGSDPVSALRDLTHINGHVGLGADRATGIVTNAVIPFAFAFAEHTGDVELADAAALAWERLPAAEANQVSRRAHRQVAGTIRLPKLGARGQQGLIHLDATLCAPRRCYECPIAHRVVTDGIP